MRTKIGAKLGVMLAVGLLAAGGLSGRARAQDTAMKLDIGDTAPDFSLEEFSSGKPVALANYLGKKVVMLEFWATWCDICKTEMPRLVKEYDEYKGKGYELLAITLSRGDDKDRKKIEALKEKNQLSYPILMDTEFEVATKIYGLSGPIPLKVIIDCEGKIRYTHVGDYADGVSEVPFVLDELLGDPACKP
ncbi:MAG: TlpA family protein disulfide reductase [Proteobacteria bacterium]|nr:TlpA family protein disulfide reductase [Pseudomonadota bacterium]